MSTTTFEVGWRPDRPRPGWTCRPDPSALSGTEGFHPLERWTPRRFNRARGWRGPQTKRHFMTLVGNRYFSSWWQQVAAGEEDKLFLLNFPEGIWDLPWELLVENLIARYHPHVLIARGIGAPIPESPTVFDKPLEVLIVKGAPAAPGYRRLNLEAEMALIEEAWAGLPFAARECVKRPGIANAADLPVLLREHRPDVLWFSGHGRPHPQPGLLFADNAWVTPEEFAGFIRTSGHVPLYTVFWACDTGRAGPVRAGTSQAEPDESGVGPPGPAGAGAVSSPAFFTALTQAGVMSSLLVRAPIGDRSARKLARTLFVSLSTGLSLETATARARAELLDYARAQEHADPGAQDAARALDWALPVVWSSGRPELRLEWDRVEQARLQILGGKTLLRSLTTTEDLSRPLTRLEQDRASAWVRRRRNWIAGRFDSEDQQVWLRTLLAIQDRSALAVICVDLTQDVGTVPNTETALETWAEGVYRSIRPGEVPGPVTNILRAMQRRPQTSWQELCSRPGVFLAVVQPPAGGTPGTGWFWRSLRSARTAAVLSPDPIPEDTIGEWGQPDRISQTVDDETVTAAVRQAPRLARALAVLGHPIAPGYLTLPDPPDGQPGNFHEWTLAGTILIETGSGRLVMSASARDYVLRQPDPGSREQAHRDCLVILSKLRPTLPVSDEILRHLIGAGMDGEACQHATYLCTRYWEERQPQAVRRTIRRLGPRWSGLWMAARLIAAWANVSVGDMPKARMWLARAQPAEPLDKAWKHALQAEVLKSEGTEASKQGALDSIEQAIACAEAAQNGDDETRFQARRRWRAYRQDRARILQYLFYDPAAAALEYEALIRESRDDPDADLDVAVVQRNYAECLRSLVAGPDDPRWQTARAMLQDALDAANVYPGLPLKSEILYEQARMAQAQSDVRAAVRLLGECIEAAGQAGHGMMAAVAANKRFWLTRASAPALPPGSSSATESPFPVAEWQVIADGLAGFSDHGWAARSLMNSRIRAARELAGERTRLARSLLQENLDLLRESRAFSVGRSDQWRIALSYAGLDVLAGAAAGPGRPWAEFLATYSWARAWLADRAIRDAAQAWREL